MNYQEFWRVRLKIIGFSNASTKEARLIYALSSEIAIASEKKLVLYDLGCGDGRMVVELPLSHFSKIVLCDYPTIVHEAHRRLSAQPNCPEVCCATEEISRVTQTIMPGSLVLCCGLLSLFPNEKHLSIIRQILVQNPSGVVLTLPSYGFWGFIYLRMNIVRGRQAEKLCGFLLRWVDSRFTVECKNKIVSIAMNLLFSLIEPLLPAYIYRLTFSEYSKYFEVHGYKMRYLENSGFGTIIGFRKQHDKV